VTTGSGELEGERSGGLRSRICHGVLSGGVQGGEVDGEGRGVDVMCGIEGGLESVGEEDGFLRPIVRPRPRPRARPTASVVVMRIIIAGLRRWWERVGRGPVTVGERGGLLSVGGIVWVGVGGWEGRVGMLRVLGGGGDGR
jgi:hypothetical protein